jgi:prepilin-type N-terminal cleavage/methylation domain-containing protein
MSARNRRRGSLGFTLIETLIVILLIGIASVIVMPYIQSTIRHEKLRSSVREVYSIILAARMQAVKRNTRAIVAFDLPNHRVYSWAEDLPFDFVYTNTETKLAEYEVPRYIYFRFAPVGLAVDSQSAVAFDTYAGNAALVDMVIYQGDGTLLAPQGPSSGPPLRPGTLTASVPNGSVNCNGGGGRARGIYMSDQTTTGDVNDRNTFRISVDDFGSNGRASLLKWLPTSEGGNAGEYNYVPGPWKWAY